MILPKKHTSVEESIFGFGAYLLNHIEQKPTIDGLWKKYLKEYEESIYNTKFSFDQFIITIDYLFLLGAIEINKKGELVYATN